MTDPLWRQIDKHLDDEERDIEAEEMNKEFEETKGELDRE